jgi:hypothetical protein
MLGWHSGDSSLRLARPDETCALPGLAKTTHREFVMSQVLQILGAIMILAPFALAQFRVLGQQSFHYLFLNLLGSSLLAGLALEEHQWGFLLLEGVWALVSLWVSASISTATEPDAETPQVRENRAMSPALRPS